MKHALVELLDALAVQARRLQGLLEDEHPGVPFPALDLARLAGSVGAAVSCLTAEAVAFECLLNAAREAAPEPGDTLPRPVGRPGRA